jgi:hypothetical protein
MSTFLADFVDKIIGLKRPEVIDVDGRPYSTVDLRRVSEPSAPTLEVNTLTSIIEYIKSKIDEMPARVLIHVESHDRVRVYAPIRGKFAQRDCLMVCSAPSIQMRLGAFMSQEAFVIQLQSCFVDSGSRKDLLKVVGSITDSAVRQSTDDGVTQEVTVKQGVSMQARTDLPSRVLLAPYRTFIEVEQPESEFVLRAKEGPQIALFEADGGEWMIDAKDSIVAFLREQLPEDKAVIIA